MKFSSEILSWIVIVIGGIVQIVWAIGLDYTDGFRNVYWDAIVIVFLFISIWCLSFSMKGTISVSTAYTVWIGIGVVGTIIVSATLGLETLRLMTIIFLIIVIGGVIGLKMTPTEKKCDNKRTDEKEG
jgi:quaternary ammonium compound-resistance protein SugE